MINSLLDQALYFLFKTIPHTGIIVGNHTQNRIQIKHQVDILGRYFEFIHHDEVAGRIQQKKKKKPFCVLTFDDGKKMIAEQTAPELEKMGVPAVFYLVTDMVSENQPLWFDCRNALKKAALTPKENQQLAQLKTLPIEHIHKYLAQLCEKYQVMPDMDDPCVVGMSWADVQKLYKKGFTIGAHTCSHPVLTNETHENACGEIRRSIDLVSEKMGVQCPSFAFPNGNYTQHLARYAMACGVNTVMTTDPMWVNSRTRVWRLPRIDLYNHYGAPKMLVKITAAIPGFVLKNPNGTGRAYAGYTWKM